MDVLSAVGHSKIARAILWRNAMQGHTRIVITRRLLPVDQKYITDGLVSRVGDCFDLVEPPSFDDEGICSVVGDADVLLGPYVSDAVLDAGEQIGLIQVPWTGMDSFDFDVARRHPDIPVCNSHSNAVVVAELGVSIVLDLLKKVSYHDRKMRLGDWNRSQEPLDLKSRMLNQSTVCVLGYGHIGSNVGGMLQALCAKVIAVDGTRVGNIDGVNVCPVESMCEAVSMSDIVIVTLPLTESTRGMIDADFIGGMKDDSFLVLLSRAAIVDEDAVWDALQGGKLSGFASDVWWRTPRRGESGSRVSERHDFEALDHVVLSPHRAGFSENSLPHLDDVIENLTRFIKFDELINVVDTSVQY